jgi:hypothetical protein
MRRNQPPDWETRSKIHELVRLPQAELLERLKQWPRFQQWTLEEQGRFLIRLQEVREMQADEAKNRAKSYGISLKPEQEAAFENAYWSKRIAKEKVLFEKIDPMRKQMEEELKNELRNEFASSLKK